MKIRLYNEKKDYEATIRVWQECGWLKEEVSKHMKKAFSATVKASTAMVAEEQGRAECLVLTMPAQIMHMHTELPFTAVIAVTTSHLIRKRGAATKVTAKSLARAAAEGSVLAGLGIFDQGFYNKLGFGCFPYTHTARFDPGALSVPHLRRRPVRLAPSDAGEIHRNIQKRKKVHGAVTIAPEAYVSLGCYEGEGAYGLGFRDPDSGELTHHLWINPKERESGPYEVWWMAYQNYAQLLELFSLLKSLDDQVLLVRLREPPYIQVQDFLKRPFRSQSITKGGKFESATFADAYQQCRILNLEKFIPALSVQGAPLQFVLDLHDPVEAYLDESEKWRGCGGPWTIKLGTEKSTVERGARGDLERLETDVGSLTQLCFGVQRASSLAMNAKLKGSASLVNSLDEAILLPTPDMITDY